MDKAAFVNVVEADCDLEEAVDEPLRVQVFVLVAEKTLLK